MDTRLIEYLVALQEEKSFSKAAKRLFLTPSALNQQLSRLEQELGVQLFERNGRNLVPTAAGNIYLAGARKMLIQLVLPQNNLHYLFLQVKVTLEVLPD